jgi:hypothetical protein
MDDVNRIEGQIAFQTRGRLLAAAAAQDEKRQKRRCCAAHLACGTAAGPPRLGTPALVEIVREIKAADPARPLGKVSKRQRAMLRLQSELGDLVDRPGRLLEAKHWKPKRRKT